jgi:hypothetical protein
MQRSEMPERSSTRDRRAQAARRGRLENRAPLLALGVFLLVFLVALGSSRSLAHVGGPGDLAGARRVAGDLIVLVVASAVIPAMLFVIWESIHALRGEEAPGLDEHNERRVIKPVLVMALVAGAIAALSLGQAEPGRVPEKRAPRSTHTKRVPAASPSHRTAEALAPWVAVGVGTCFVLLIAATVVRRRRDGLAMLESPEYELDSPRRELHEQVGISIAEIEREADPRRAVIRAYTGMESTLARHGLGRRPFEAPGEYLGRAFATLRLSRRPGERLTELFERARFSAHAIGPEMKRESIAALGELRSELEAKPR